MPSIQWLKDGVPVESLLRPQNQQPYLLRPNKWEVKIRGAMKSDEGNYTCIVSNSVGAISHSYKVEVLQYYSDVPRLVQQSDNLTLIQGMDAHFSCKFKSHLSFNQYWFRPSEALRLQGKQAIIDGANHSHFEALKDENGDHIMGEHLVVENVQPEDAGKYFCMASTTSAIQAGHLKLTVIREDETILQNPKNITVEEGETATFYCRSHGTLRDAISWVRITDEVKILKNRSEVLEIQNVTYADVGAYACVVGNDDANVEAVAYLSVEDPVAILLPPNKTHFTVRFLDLFSELLLRTEKYCSCLAGHAQADT